MKFTLEHDVIIIEQQTFSSAEEVSSWLALLAEQVSLRIVEVPLEPIGRNG